VEEIVKIEDTILRNQNLLNVLDSSIFLEGFNTFGGTGTKH